MEGPPPKRSSRPWAALAFFLIAGSAVAIFLYATRGNAPLPVSNSGFNLASLPGKSSGSQALGQAAGLVSEVERSGLDLVRSGLPGLIFGGSSARNSQAQKLAESFIALCRSNEGKAQSLAMAYTRRYPAIRQYGRDWMSYPDLKKLNDDYMRDHDPVKFLRGLAASKNFGLMVKKYAARPEIQGFIRDAIKQAPPPLLSQGLGYLSDDQIAKGLVDQVARALGLPSGILGGGSSRIDSKAVMGSINSQIQKAASQIQASGQ